MAEHSKWYRKNVLVIGDSITSDGRWQKEFARITGCNIRTHANGGIGLIDMVDGQEGTSADGAVYDPTTGVSGKLGPLTGNMVRWADLIILLGAYNERHMEYGERGDMYPAQNTLRGKFAYVIERIYALLDAVDNLGCHLMLVTPHCSGQYDWVPVDGYTEWPAGSGRSLETMAEVVKQIAGEYNIYCCDAWHTSGINRFTWKHYCHSAVVMAPDYDPEKEYDAPYPQFADQAHLNAEGYARLGDCIAAAAENA